MPLLVKLGASEAVQAKYSAAGDYLVAYILYEIAKPVRYVVTLAGTRQAVLLLRTRGSGIILTLLVYFSIFIACVSLVMIFAATFHL